MEDLSSPSPTSYHLHNEDNHNDNDNNHDAKEGQEQGQLPMGAISTITTSHSHSNAQTHTSTSTSPEERELSNTLCRLPPVATCNSSRRQRLGLPLQGKDSVVIVKSYYISHSLRYPPLMQTGKPEDPNLSHLSPTTWFEIQAQLGPLVRRHLFLPKSYVFVPLVCLISAVGLFICYSIANASHNKESQEDAGSSVSKPAMIFWSALFLLLLAMVWLAFARWVQKRNRPVDEELRQICLELSRSKTQAEGYRLEYHKCGSNTFHDPQHNIFATRVLRFVPLPIPSKITVPASSKHSDVEAQPHTMQRQASSISTCTDSSDFPTLQSLSAMDFVPFPTSDAILENLASLLFVLVIFQCFNSLQ